MMAFVSVSPLFAAPPDQIVIQGRLSAEDPDLAEVVEGVQTYEVVVRVEDETGALLHDYAQDVEFHEGIFDLSFGDDALKERDYSLPAAPGGIYIVLQINLIVDDVLTPVTFSRTNLGGHPQSFMAYNMKDGTVEARGEPPFTASSNGMSAGISVTDIGGHGLRGLVTDWGVYGSGVVLGQAGSTVLGQYTGLGGSVNINPRTKSFPGGNPFPIDSGYGAYGYSPTGVGVMANSSIADYPALYATNNANGRALSVGREGIQFYDMAGVPVGSVDIGFGVARRYVAHPRVDGDALILLTIQNGVSERVWIDSQGDGFFYIRRSNTIGESINVAYFVIN